MGGKTPKNLEAREEDSILKTTRPRLSKKNLKQNLSKKPQKAKEVQKGVRKDSKEEQRVQREERVREDDILIVFKKIKVKRVNN